MFSFNVFSSQCSKQLLEVLLKTFDEPPIIICIGSDLSIGDSFAPIIGTNIYSTFCKNGNLIYGTLKKTITAKEIPFLKKYLNHTHPSKKILVIDAAVGKEEDIGLVKFKKGGIMPGGALNKNLGNIGDYSIIGIVAESSILNYSLFNLTRLNLVFEMANKVATSLKNMEDALSKPRAYFNYNRFIF